MNEHRAPQTSNPELRERIAATLRIIGTASLLLLVCLTVTLDGPEKTVVAIIFGALVGIATVWGAFGSLRERNSEKRSPDSPKEERPSRTSTEPLREPL